MYRAVYYPHSTIRDEAFLRSALLLWDELDLIVPDSHARSHSFPDPIANLAAELLTRRMPPTGRELDAIHTAVEDIVTSEIPPWMQLDYAHADRSIGAEYAIYTKKMRGDTWALLVQSNLARRHTQAQDMEVSGPLGLFLMSLFADTRAGNERRIVTDRVAAYVALSQYHGWSPSGAEAPVKRTTVSESEAIASLVPMGVRVVNTDLIPIARLVDLRRREAVEQRGSELRTLRHSYVQHLDQYIKRYSRPDNTDEDRRVIMTEYQESIEERFTDLKRELGFAKRDVVFSREMLVTIASVLTAAAGAFAIEPSFTGGGAVAAVGGVGAVHTKYAKARHQALRAGGNPASWLYTAAALP